METITKRVQNSYGNEEYVLVPPADIIEEAEGYVLVCDMPGVAPDKLDITVENDRLEITGHTAESSTDDKTCAIAEFTWDYNGSSLSVKKSTRQVFPLILKTACSR
jgi:HSP20 family molecular chaperone IbpA